MAISDSDPIQGATSPAVTVHVDDGSMGLVVAPLIVATREAGPEGRP